MTGNLEFAFDDDSVACLDPALGYALLRFGSHVDRQRDLWQEAVNRDFELINGSWFPRSSETVMFLVKPDGTKSRLYTARLSVKSIDLTELPDSFFTMAVPAGALVADSTELPKVNG